MLTRILLVAIFILLSWNSFQISKSNELLRSEIKKLSINDQIIEDYSIVSKSILDKQSRILDEHSLTLDENSKLSLSNRETLNTLTKKY